MNQISPGTSLPFEELLHALTIEMFSWCKMSFLLLSINKFLLRYVLLAKTDDTKIAASEIENALRRIAAPIAGQQCKCLKYCGRFIVDDLNPYFLVLTIVFSSFYDN